MGQSFYCEVCFESESDWSAFPDLSINISNIKKPNALFYNQFSDDVMSFAKNEVCNVCADYIVSNFIKVFGQYGHWALCRIVFQFLNQCGKFYFQ